MEQITRALVLCVIAALTGLLLRKSNPEIALLLALAAAVTVLMQLAAPVRELFDFLKRLTGYSGVSDMLFLPLYKTIGIALIVRIGGNLCKDAGQNALASVLEFAGAICALVTALPLLSAVLDLLTELIL